ncbi:MAG: NAD(P)-dependent oxidoreductase [Nitrososphaerota archaeon]|nr:NAD(P)-dependent oxidoreductase [Nitrososphaerota archaeon]MDG7038403.1 NAD(P)-dependent oxidoreductase [Nitrososphaerota archaeon]MDG7048066.1 NAD(P)-dependent oxidoreductase [Nitrososphaerota archaeon]
MTNKPRIGFIGLGIMGSLMASNLIKAGFSLTVYNRSRGKADKLKAQGAQVVETPAKAAKLSDVVVEMVTDAPDVEQVLFGDDGLINGKHEELTVIGMSTNSPRYAIDFAKRLMEMGIDFIDAPVTGGDKGARDGTLTIMAGGKPEVFRRVMPVLEAMGKNIVYTGETGTGQMVKLLNQIVIGMDMLGVSEALALARRTDTDLDALYRVLSTGAANSFTVQYYLPKMIKNDITPGFRALHLRKDLKYVMDVANELNMPMVGTSLLLQLYNALIAQGFGDNGTQALIKFYEKFSH